jgi:hypothetical protein
MKKNDKVYLVFTGYSAHEGMWEEMVGPAFLSRRSADAFVRAKILTTFGIESWKQRKGIDNKLEVPILGAPKKPWVYFRITWVKVI